MANSRALSGMMDFMKKVLLSAVPVAIVAGFLFFASTNRDRFPDPVAIHWGLSGDPDGFGTLDSQLAITALVMGFMTLMWVAAVFLKAIPTSVRILFLAIIGVLWSLLFVIFAYTLLIQLDIQSAQDARIGIGFFIFTLGVPLLLLPWVLAKPKLEVGDRFKVRYWQLPVLTLDYAHMSSVSVGEVKAGDFGGWGIRYSQKTTAFIPSSGPALEIRLEAGERILVRTNLAAQLVQEIDAKRGKK